MWPDEWWNTLAAAHHLKEDILGYNIYAPSKTLKVLKLESSVITCY